MNLKKACMNRFECKDCGPMDKYVGCTIGKLESRVRSGGIKLWQRVLLQEATWTNSTLEVWRSSTPMRHLEQLSKNLSKVMRFFTHVKHMLYCSDVTENKGMHKMQCLRPDTYNAVHNLARHMTHVMKVHFEAMLRMIMKCSKFDEKKEWKQGPLVCH